MRISIHHLIILILAGCAANGGPSVEEQHRPDQSQVAVRQERSDLTRADAEQLLRIGDIGWSTNAKGTDASLSALHFYVAASAIDDTFAGPYLRIAKYCEANSPFAHREFVMSAIAKLEQLQPAAKADPELQETKARFEWDRSFFGTKIEQLRPSQAHAMWRVGICFDEGAEGLVDKDYTEAAKWFHEAALRGDPNGMASFGRYLYLGRGGLAQDYPAAVRWIRESARAKSESGLYMLGVFYEYGVPGMILPNKEDAIRYYQAAAASRFEYAVAALKRLGH